jgi:hypothetical protein
MTMRVQEVGEKARPVEPERLPGLATPKACCGSAEQTSCCEPAAKTACCGGSHVETCGCR